MGTGSLSLSCWGSSSLNVSMGDINKIERERDRRERWKEGRREKERKREKVMKTVELSITISNKFCCQPSATNPPAI